jgi:hypothetical protein
VQRQSAWMLLYERLTELASDAARIQSLDSTEVGFRKAAERLSRHVALAAA